VLCSTPFFNHHLSHTQLQLNATASQPAHVHSLRVLGTERTRNSFLKLATNNTFSGMTVADIINDVQQTADKLQRLDIFDSVNVILDTSKDPFAAKDAIDVIFSVKEKSRFFLKTGTEIGNGEGNMVSLHNCKPSICNNSILNCLTPRTALLQFVMYLVVLKCWKRQPHLVLEIAQPSNSAWVDLSMPHLTRE
jgi:hypothetical protein